MPDLLLTKPTKGFGVHWRSHHHLEEDCSLPRSAATSVVGLACIDDDANRQITEVFWEREVDTRVLVQSPHRNAQS